MDSKIDVMPSAKNQYIAAIVMNIIVFCHGCSIGWVSPSLALLSGPDTPLDEPLTPDQAALVGSLICVGAIPFTSMFGWIADRNGRKTAAIVCAFPYLACWLMKLLWRTAIGLMVARFLGGVAASGLFMLSPLYASEVASVHTRGALSSLMVFSINIGIVFMYVLGAYASYTTVLAVMIPLPVIFVLLMLRMPETPSFLVKKNRFEEAAKALSWLRGLPVDCGMIKKELDSLKSEVELAKNTAVDSHFIVNNQRNTFSTMSYGALKYPILNREPINQDFANYSASDDMGNAASGLENVPSWKIFISSVPTRRAFAVICTLLTIQCFMGLFAVITYSNDIFARAGSSLSPSTSSIIVGLLQFFGSVVASSLIERLGRKVLLTSSCLAVSLSMAAMGTFFFLSDSGMDVSSISWIPILAMSVAVSTFAMGAGPVPYCLTSEVFMIQTRGIATSILLTWVWVASFIIAQFFGSAVTLVGIGSVFWIFALAGFGGIIITIFFLPETKGRTMNEILEYFEGDKSRKITGKSSETGELL